ncbi:hypothetical protein OF83DRAFT_1086809 [Amylostereum chailletii]|nr:hypothetical protein OF83DRAFT_1086809 [Amylostereum chailletii]
MRVGVLFEEDNEDNGDKGGDKAAVLARGTITELCMRGETGAGGGEVGVGPAQTVVRWSKMRRLTLSERKIIGRTFEPHVHEETHNSVGSTCRWGRLKCLGGEYALTFCLLCTQNGLRYVLLGLVACISGLLASFGPIIVSVSWVLTITVEKSLEERRASGRRPSGGPPLKCNTTDLGDPRTNLSPRDQPATDRIHANSAAFSVIFAHIGLAQRARLAVLEDHEFNVFVRSEHEADKEEGACHTAWTSMSWIVEDGELDRKNNALSIAVSVGGLSPTYLSIHMSPLWPRDGGSQGNASISIHGNMQLSGKTSNSAGVVARKSRVFPVSCTTSEGRAGRVEVRSWEGLGRKPPHELSVWWGWE